MTSSAIDLRRRQLLRGRVRSEVHPLRPPWALPEAAFTTACDRCDACIGACEVGILSRGDGGFPTVNFRLGACTFCAACLDVCKPGALRGDSRDKSSAYSLSVQIDDSCLSIRGITCRTCGDHCPSGAIRFRLQTGGRAVPEISAVACTGCGACLQPCPTGSVAIRNTPSEAAA